MRNLIIGLTLGLLLSGGVTWAFHGRPHTSPPLTERQQYDRYLQDAYRFGPLPEWEEGRSPWSSSKTPC